MLYRKNIYRWEQWSRVVLGLGMAAWGLLVAGNLLGYGVAAAGAGLAVTGIVGWCPACAMIGRRVKDRGQV
jgi:hypothetical protein